MKSQSEMSDEKLIRFYLSSNPAAMETLSELYKDRIYSSIFNLMPDKFTAVHIFNQVLITMVNSIIAGKMPDDDFLQWSISISNRLCMEHTRSNSACPINPLHNVGIRNRASGHLVNECYHDTHTSIKTHISMLPDQQREVMALSHYAGLSFKEIAGIMKCSVTNVLDILHAALNNLRKLLIENEKIAA